MTETLCGRYPCKHLCSRVQHCPAGMERVRWLSLCKRGQRGESETRTVSLPPKPSNVDPETGEILEPLPSPGKLLPIHATKQQAVPYTKNLKPYTQVAVVSAMILIVGLVVLFGIILNDGDFAPDYEPPKTYHYER